MLVLYASLLVALGYIAASFRSDLHLINSALEQLRGQLSNRQQPSRVSAKTYTDPSTAAGKRTFTSISLIKNALAEGSWGALQKVEDQASLPIPEIRSQDPRTLNGDDFYTHLCRSITLKFRSKLVALGVWRGEGDLSIVSEGIESSRIIPYISESYRSYFSSGDESALGLQDSGKSREILNDCSAFGCRYALALPFSPKAGERGLIWLGYQYCAPSDFEIRLARALAARIGGEVRTREELVSIYEEIRRVEKVDHKYIATLSHDIRTPLNTLRNALALVKLEGGTLDQPSLCEVLLEQCDHMGAMVEDLTDYSRHQSGKLRANPEILSANDLLYSLLRTFEPQAAAKSIRLILERAECAAIRFDRKHLRRILSNLIDNAIKYTGQGGVVRLRSETDQGKCILTVEDNGKGFAADELPRAFEPFERFDSQNDGTGLGLAISKALTELNGARLEISSTSGEGSRLRMLIPNRDVEREVPDMERSAAELPNSALSPKPSETVARKILVVDDDKDTVDLLMATLERAGYSALGAYSVAEAIGIIQLGSPDVVITDGSMPGGGGRQILKSLRKAFKQIPVAIISGKDDRHEREQMREAGVAKFFLKPVPFEDVVAWVNTVWPAH